MNWIKDEYGRVLEIQGWTIRDWINSGVDCTGPEGQSLEYDAEEDTVSICHEAPYDGSVSVGVPVKVVEEFLRVSRESKGLENLRDAGTILMANGYVEKGIDLEEALVELKTLREIVTSGNPICPHCSRMMIPNHYEGYYDAFDYWQCSCKELEVENSWKGGFA